MKSLNLSNNRLSDKSMGDLMKAINDTKIEKLILQSNKLTDKCVETIVVALRPNKSLKVLNLGAGQISTRNSQNKLKNGLLKQKIEVIFG